MPSISKVQFVDAPTWGWAGLVVPAAKSPTGVRFGFAVVTDLAAKQAPASANHSTPPAHEPHAWDARAPYWEGATGSAELVRRLAQLHRRGALTEPIAQPPTAEGMPRGLRPA